ncbi:MAG: SIS domain-containing protein [Cellvibrionaceae bacterium]
MQNRVIQTIHQSIETKMQAGETLAPLIEAASLTIVNALLNEKKILVAGNGNSSALGQIFVSNLLNRLEQERPSLPAISISADSTALTAIANDASYNDIFAKQIRAFGQEGDVLILVSTTGDSSNIVQALAAAHDKNIPIIALTGHDGGDLATLLNQNDIELRAPSDSNIHINEVHLLSLLCLCDLIDFQLFGAQE